MSSGIAQTDNKNPERVAAGLKATIHNSNTSDEAKNRAQDRLDQMGVELDKPGSTQTAKETVDTYDQADYGKVLDDEDKDLLRNKRGLQVGTRQAAEPGKYAGMDASEDDDDDDFGNDGRSRGFSGGQPGEGRELGGYKATLKNPNVSEKAKKNAERVLNDNDAL